MAAFQGQLNVNKIYGAIYNQILAQEVNSKNILYFDPETGLRI